MTAPRSSREDASPLMDVEIAWRDRYVMLEAHGYRLRPRFRPDWKPSWLETDKIPQYHEDYYANKSSVTIDAIRISDGWRVFLKRVRASSSELTILRHLSDEERLRDPRNHTAPLLDEFLDNEDSSYAYIVLPLLHAYYEPGFFSVDEVVDFMKQLLEGLVYMHKLNIAHRDCSDLNIMMDADKMFPRGFHPNSTIADASGYRLARPLRRRDVSYARYYFIDFGISTMFAPDDEYKRVVGVHGQDDEVPELSDTKSYDPFFVDVFILGNLFKKAFLEKYTNLGFLKPLVEEMTEHHWMNRCTASQSLGTFKRIIYRQSWYALRWRLKENSTGRATQAFQDIGTFSRETVFFATSSIRSSAHGATKFLRKRLRLKTGSREEFAV